MKKTMMFLAVAVLAGCGGVEDASPQELGQEAVQAACDCDPNDAVRTAVTACADPGLATCFEHSKFNPVTQRHYDTPVVGCLMQGRLCVPSCEP